MKIVIHSGIDVFRRATSFSTSGLIHAAVLAYLVLGAAWQHAGEPRKSLYDQQIRPFEKKIVWYHVREALPEIRPPKSTVAARRPLRATRKFTQEIVSGARDDKRPPQLVWAPAPQVKAPKPQALPNVIAVQQRALTKTFTPPPEKTLPQVTPSLPDAPQTSSALTNSKLPLEPDRPKQLLKEFQRPTVKTAAATLPVLPDAPQTSSALTNSKLPLEPDRPKPLVKEFQRPTVKTAAATLPSLPDAPQVTAKLDAAAPAIPGSGLKPLTKKFTPPAAPARKVESAPAPELPTVSGPPAGTAELAIVGLNPASIPALPPAPPAHDAGFSAGPNLRRDGAATDGAGAALTVPGLTVRSASKDAQPSVVPRLKPQTREMMLAGVRASMPPPGTPPPSIHLPPAPDPSLQGRVYYTVAIQMPNVTSYSGSWIVWFAEREPLPGTAAVEMHAPAPLRKVDPKYVASAAADRVEGTVRLAAIIRKTGTVDSVSLLRHLDDRLDQTAIEALSKWQFEPARRNGTPVDVDAVFEIPFRLAPKPLK